MAEHLAITGIGRWPFMPLFRLITSGRRPCRHSSRNCADAVGTSSRACCRSRVRRNDGHRAHDVRVSSLRSVSWERRRSPWHISRDVPVIGQPKPRHGWAEAGDGFGDPPWFMPFTPKRCITGHCRALGTSGEYAAQGTAGYTRDFIPAMRRNAADVRAHWERLNKGRPPRIWTFAAGALPHEYSSAYIFEELVSFRHRCPQREKGERPDSRQWRGARGLHSRVHATWTAQQATRARARRVMSN